MKSRINELAESCIYWTSFSLADDEDGNDHKCESSNDHARKMFICKYENHINIETSKGTEA